jgi:hypothetical protein
MIPKAWYSIIDDRLIRPSNPCCIPRLNRMMATFGEGCSHSTYYFWYHQIEEWSTAHQFNIHWHLSHETPRKGDAKANFS